jgi:broad specificity phosphatase PhoE
MKIFSARQRLVWVVSLLAVASCLLQSAVANVELKTRATVKDDFKVTTVFLVRHAEKADAPRENPALSDTGKLRSQALARLLKESGIKAIYTSQFLRTVQTAEPLAEQLGIKAIVVPLSSSQSNPREIAEQSIREITNKIYERPGEAVLIVGHSNSVPAVIKMLGGDAVPTIDEQKFDDLFIVTVFDKGKAKVVHLKYEASR